MNTNINSDYDRAIVANAIQILKDHGLYIKSHNLILMGDSYKYSHYLQYPENTQYISSYITSRKGGEKVLFFGLQMFIKKYFLTPITHEDIDEAKEIITTHGEPFNEDGWRYIVNRHKGFLPIHIQALKEGTFAPMNVPQVQVVNTDPRVPWLTSFVETMLLRAIWYPTSVATYSWECKQVIKNYLEETADNLDGLLFKLHDFGARGASSHESASIGGAGHLINFMGSDTIEAVVNIRNMYNEPMAAFSIPAAEHSTITAWGRSREINAYENMVDKFGGEGKLYAIVSDSYDIYNAAGNIWAKQLAEKVKNAGGKAVIRPDSGDATIVPIEVMMNLAMGVGYTTNSKGYKMLPSYFGVIQGDGVNKNSIGECLENMKKAGWSADNIAFGMGGQLLQKVDRDLYYYAMKGSAISYDGKTWEGFAKDPVGDKAKISLAGRHAVIKNGSNLITIQGHDLNDKINELEDVFIDGKLLREQTFTEIRALAN